MSFRISFLFGCCLLLLAARVAYSQTHSNEALRALTYYIAVSDHECTEDEVSVRGASNLPPGARIGVSITAFNGEMGWDDYSDDVYATLDDKGFFSQLVHAKRGRRFRNNLVIKVWFRPYKQSPSVLAAVGKHGERLDFKKNPQAFMESGFNALLSSIARVSCAEPTGK